MAKKRARAKRSTNRVTNRDVLMNLRRAYPIRKGYRLRAKGEPVKVNRKAATLWVYVRAGRGHYAIHETLFSKQEKHNESWWSNYFNKKVFKGTGSGNIGTPAQRMGVLKGAILPGMYLRSRKHWSVKAIIGYALHDFHQRVYASLHRKRHKAK